MASEKQDMEKKEIQNSFDGKFFYLHPSSCITSLFLLSNTHSHIVIYFSSELNDIFLSNKYNIFRDD